MRIHFLPAEQQKRNDRAVEKLRRIGYLIFVLLLATLALGARYYIWPPFIESEPQLTSDDGQTMYPDAVVLSPDYVLTPTKIVGDAEFIAPGERRKARRVGNTTLSDGTEVTLFRLESSTSVPPVSVVVIEAGDTLFASSSGQEWHGTARAKANDAYPVDPDFTLNAGTPAYKDQEKTSLAGFAVHTGSGWTVVPAPDVLRSFPVLSSGR